MIKIAHRGIFNGPNKFGENNPIDIIGSIVMGYDVEVDVWINSYGMYLGHDKPEHKIDETFIEDIKDKAWFHCKNIEALEYFVKNMPDARFFWHQEDDYTLTNTGHIWTYPGKNITDKSIIVVKEKTDLSIYADCYGICTQYWE